MGLEILVALSKRIKEELQVCDSEGGVLGDVHKLWQTFLSDFDILPLMSNICMIFCLCMYCQNFPSPLPFFICIIQVRPLRVPFQEFRGHLNMT